MPSFSQPGFASLLVSVLPVVPLLSRKARRISFKTRQLTPFTDIPNSKPRLAHPHRVTWSVPLVSMSIAPSFPLARVSHVNTTLQHRLRRDPYPHPRTISPSPSSQSLSSRFSHPNSFAVFASESDSASDSDSGSDSDSEFSLTSDDRSESLSSASDVDSSTLFPRQTLYLDPSPFSSLALPPVLSPVYKVSYDIQGLPVTVPLPFSASRSVNSLSTALASFAVVSALLPSSPLIADSGCTGLLLQLVNLPCLKPFFSLHPLPVMSFTLPDGSSLSAGGLSHVTGFLTFPHKLDPVPCYFLLSSDLPHSLFGVSFSSHSSLGTRYFHHLHLTRPLLSFLS